MLSWLGDAGLIISVKLSTMHWYSFETTFCKRWTTLIVKVYESASMKVAGVSFSYVRWIWSKSTGRHSLTRIGELWPTTGLCVFMKNVFKPSIQMQLIITDFCFVHKTVKHIYHLLHKIILIPHQVLHLCFPLHKTGKTSEQWGNTWTRIHWSFLVTFLHPRWT